MTKLSGLTTEGGGRFGYDDYSARIPFLLIPPLASCAFDVLFEFHPKYPDSRLHDPLYIIRATARAVTAAEIVTYATWKERQLR